MNLKIVFAKWGPFCLSLNVLNGVCLMICSISIHIWWKMLFNSTIIQWNKYETFLRIVYFYISISHMTKTNISHQTTLMSDLSRHIHTLQTCDTGKTRAKIKLKHVPVHNLGSNSIARNTDKQNKFYVQCEITSEKSLWKLAQVLIHNDMFSGIWWVDCSPKVGYVTRRP